MSEVKRWRILFEFSAEEEKAWKAHETIFAQAVLTSGFRPNISLEEVSK